MFGILLKQTQRVAKTGTLILITKKNMDLSQYYYFFEVVRAGSVRKAAETLFVSPSALSRHIKRIEQLHNATLFYRSAKGMELTEVGKLVYNYTELILNQRRVLMNQIHDIKNLDRGTLTYCSIEGVLNSLLLPAISNFQKNHPNIHFKGGVASSADVYKSVADGTADFGVAFEQPDLQLVEEASQFYSNIVAVADINNPFNEDKINFKDLKGVPLAMLNGGFYTRQLTDTLSKKFGFSLNIIFEIDQIEIIKQLIQDRSYITILPDFSVQKEIQNKRFKIIKIADESLKNIKTVIIYKKNRYRSQRLISFLETLKKEVNGEDFKIDT